MSEVVLASDNQGKIQEINSLLRNTPLEVVGQGSLGVEPIEETGTTFIDNALLKARNAARQTGRPAIADDSGLEVDALDGRPGVYSARFAGAQATDTENVEKLLAALDGLAPEKRGARFRCAMVYVTHADDADPLICEGAWAGKIITEPKGDNGFGYDPIFWIEGEKATAAELAPERKNILSHRGQALRMLVAQLAERS
ncbi:MAG: RdgB/HAM1 family non-canonical purine NTP pyrophosphatase [Arenicellales bacterium]|jgi:XTP/dITP diphosphohydrolase